MVNNMKKVRIHKLISKGIKVRHAIDVEWKGIGLIPVVHQSTLLIFIKRLSRIKIKKRTNFTDFSDISDDTMGPFDATHLDAADFFAEKSEDNNGVNFLGDGANKGN